MKNNLNLKHIKSLNDFINESKLEESSLKQAINSFNDGEKRARTAIEKEKWFDNLPYSERQLLFNQKKGRKLSMKEFLKTIDKIEIYNKVHYGDYSTFESYKQNSDVPYTVLCNWFDRYESYCIDNDVEQEFPDVDYIIDEPLMIDIVRNYAQQYGNNRNM